MTHPRSTYRIQLTEDLPFARVQQMVGYLADLGVSHLYLSPFLRARPGTRHFYDVADHSAVSEVLGGEEGLRALAETVHDAGMGLIGDIVPNHMSAGPWSPSWERLLAEGRSGEAAKVFDVDWETPLPGGEGKVILPVLQEPYGDALASGRLSVVEDDRGIRVTYRELSFPVSTASIPALERTGLEPIPGTPGEERTWSRMHSLLEQQHYRLVSRAAGARLVNYRRFLNVDSLAAVHVEDDVVFEQTHAKMIELVREGVFDGLRVDHIDGLADPARYLRQLRERLGEEIWLVVEVLTSPDRGIPEDWPVNGTTGYETLRLTLGLQVDPAGHQLLRHCAARHGALPDAGERWRMKAEMLDGELGPDLRRVARVMWAACQDEPAVRDVDYRTLLEAISRLATSIARYRTYVDPQTGSASSEDVATVSEAVVAARGEGGRGDIPARLWTHLEQMLSGQVRWTGTVAEAVTRFQQLTAPAMALGVERRLFTSHDALVAACELGCEPDDVPRTLARAHAEVAAMPAEGMRTTATHDTIHSEDVRLRIAALSGLAAEFIDVAEPVLAGTAPPDQVLGLRLLQVAVGVWPAEDDGRGDMAPLLTRELRQRFGTYAVEIARTHGRLTTHRHPDGAAEGVIRAWAQGLLDPEGGVALALRDIAVRAAEIGMAASLAQSLVRLTLPGVPDTYHGTQTWDDSLADPDNRRPVDVERLRTQLDDLKPERAAELWAQRRDGAVKHHVVASALQLGRTMPDALGPHGRYQPVEARGRWADHTYAYGRGPSNGDLSVVVVAPRVFGRITDGGRFEPRGRIWADTELTLPGETPWTDVLTGQTVEGDEVAVAKILDTLPVALLVAEGAI